MPTQQRIKLTKLRRKGSSSKKSSKIQVGQTKILVKMKCGLMKKCVCKYSDVPLDGVTGFVTNLNYLPIKYDMMTVRIKDKNKLASAWWDGTRWNGLRLRDGDEIMAWKRVQYCDY